MIDKRETALKERINAMAQFYKEEFKKNYGEYPEIDEKRLENDLAWAVQRYEPAQLRRLIARFVVLGDDWLKRQGYPLGLLKQKINAVLVEDSDSGSKAKTLHLVAYTQSGVPVFSTKPLEPEKE